MYEIQRKVIWESKSGHPKRRAVYVVDYHASERERLCFEISASNDAMGVPVWREENVADEVDVAIVLQLIKDKAPQLLSFIEATKP